MSVSKCVSRIEESITLAITAKAKAMKAQGLDVVGLSAGLPALRAAVAHKFEKDNGLSYKPEQIIIGCGAKHSVFIAIMTLIDEGDEVIIPTPYWVSYPEMVKVAGGKPVIVETTKENGLKLTADQLSATIKTRIKLLIIK